MTQFRIQFFDSNPENIAVNTWHCDALSLPGGYVDFVEDLTTFYQAIDSLYSSLVDNASATLTTYNMTDPKPRAPVDVRTIGSFTKGSGTLPTEVAVCLSFQGERVSGEDQARRRGRVYIGPLSSTVMASDSIYIDSGDRDTLANAAGALVFASDASITYKWCVYSPTNEDLVTVNNGWVDNAPDTQRRRGIPSAARTLWGL